MNSHKTPPLMSAEYCSVFADILSQAITGELIGMANYAAMVRLYPDAEGQSEALAHAANELGHAKAFRVAADDLGVRPIVNLEAPYWLRLRQTFLRYVDAGDRIACLIIQEVMLESFAVSMYRAVADEAHEEMAKVFRAIGDEEEGHVDHAVGDLQDALAANSEQFENKLEVLHDEVMTTLAEMLGAKDTVPHCGLCKGDCVKESLHHVGLDRAKLRGLALNHYLRTLDRIGVRGDRSLRGRETPRVSRPPVPVFAAVGHQESWGQIAAVYRAMRPPGRAPLTDADLREVVPWIPPRTVSRFHVAAGPAANPVAGIYVDTFITPDELALGPTRRLVAKVHDGIRAAEREGARVATLGGFTSILLEAIAQPPAGNLVLTTGNTLTAALIVRGIERAARLLGRPLDCETLLVIGATGDVGSACARCFAGRTRRLLLAARNRNRLESEAARLRRHGPVEESTDVSALLAEATMIIAAASTPAPCFALAACHPEALICDAGYPKNIRIAPEDVQHRRVFWGGMGVLGGGLWSDDGILEEFYRFPSAYTAHGCLLEGAVLAIAGRFEPFSIGRGRITPERVDEMLSLSCTSGVTLAPLFDAAGLWREESAP